MARKLFLLGVVLAVTFSKVSAAVPPPAYFYDEVSRYLTVTYQDFNKVRIEIRTVGAPGEFSKWNADGDKKEKEIIFSRTPGEDEPRGTFYVAAGGDSHLTIKLKPKQSKDVKDEGVVGKYQHLTDAKRGQLAKKEFEAADKRLNELLKTLPKKWPAADKAVAVEIKTRWPSLRDRIAALNAGPIKTELTPKPPLGMAKKPEGAAEDKTPEQWLVLVAATGQQLGFANGTPDPKVKDGWVGDYDDGFGGSLSINKMQDGNLRIVLASARAGEETRSEINGYAKVTAAKDGGEEVALFTDNNPEIKEPSAHARAKLKLVGHYVTVDAENTARYSAKGWFNGVFRRQPPAVE